MNKTLYICGDSFCSSDPEYGDNWVDLLTVSWDFSKYTTHECSLNLWDDYNPALLRPYYHITDTKLIKSVYTQYAKMLNL